MGISLADLPPKLREKVLAKLAIEEDRKRNAEGNKKTTGKLRDKSTGKLRSERTGRDHNKYGAKKVEACLRDGTPHTFDSVKEFDRYCQLSELEQTGRIKNLLIQVPFELIPSQREPDVTGPRGSVKKGRLLERECVYIADFVYETPDGETVVEDVKGYRDTRSAAYAKFTIKRKLMLWKYGMRIKET